MAPRKHKWSIDEFLDSARDHLGRMLDNMSPRDIIYIISWISATILIYNSISGIKKIIFQPGKLLSRRAEFARYSESEIADFDKDIDWNQLMLCMVSAYVVLKIDVSDVASALTKVSSAIATAAVV